MHPKILTILLILGLLAAACQPGSPTPLTSTPTPAAALTDTPSPLPPATETPVPAISPTAEGTSNFTPTSAAPARPEEAILIQDPAPAHR